MTSLGIEGEEAVPEPRADQARSLDLDGEHIDLHAYTQHTEPALTAVRPAQLQALRRPSDTRLPPGKQSCVRPGVEYEIVREGVRTTDRRSGGAALQRRIDLLLDEDYAKGVWNDREPPCLSLYQPTHRHHPDNQQDPVRFRHGLKTLEASLRQKVGKERIRALLEPFERLADDRKFWNHTQDGLAVLGSRDMFRVYRLQRPVAELAIVANSFHTKPLLRILQSADRFHILAVSRRDIRLYEGNRDALDEIEPAPNVPRTVTEALGEELTKPRLTVASYGGTGRGHPAMRHGHGGREAEVDSDAERYFRAVDRAILEHHSRPSGLPMILAGLPEHHHLFHKVSHNPHLLKDGIDVHPDALASIDELRMRAWQLVEPRYLARLTALADQFNGAKSKGLAADELAAIAGAIVGGRVATLLIEARREIPGRIDIATGEIEFDDLAHPELDDVLDDMGALALKQGADVVVVPAERMPTGTGAAAILRY